MPSRTMQERTSVPAKFEMPAKITRPVLKGVCPRPRLFSALDQSRKRPVVWISAPAGSGKTTLVVSYLQIRKLPAVWYQGDAGDGDVASFFYYCGLAADAAAPSSEKRLPLLTSEYLGDLTAFSLNYFREFFARLKRPGIFAIDNYQDIPTDSAVQTVLQYALNEIPAGINVVVISREEPPGTLARLRISGQISLLGWDDIKLAERESAQIVGARHRGAALSSADIASLHRETQGWVAGLVLLSEHPQRSANAQKSHTEIASQSLFDYFANEIFSRGDPAIQSFLLKTSFLSKISPTVAQQLTEEIHSETILQDLTRRNYFTVRLAEGSYEYHPLFRAFLMRRMESVYTPSEVKQLKLRGAEILAATGDIETAIRLLQQAEDWPAALRLTVKHAPLLRAQGRTQTLEHWLAACPETLRRDDPWALYWSGMCRLHFAPAEARSYFERAFSFFERDRESSPLYLAWSRIVDTFLLELDDLTPMLDWLERYPTLRGDRTPPARGIENASVFTYVAGLTNGCLDHPELPAYVERAERLFFSEINSDRRLALGATLVPYYLWKGDLIKMGSLLDRLTPGARAPDVSSLARINWYMWKSIHAAMTGAAAESLQAVTDGLALADSSGIHSLDLYFYGYGISGQLYVGDIAQARALAQRMARVPRRGQINNAIYSHFASPVSLQEGNFARAVEEARSAAEIAKKTGLCIGAVTYQLGLAFAYIAHGNVDAAADVLADIRVRAARVHSVFFDSYCALGEAIVHFQREQPALGLKFLEESLSKARDGGFGMPAYCPRDTAAWVYASALDAGICVDYVRTNIARMRLSPPAGLLSLHWPWKIRLHALGRFAVYRDGAALTFHGKTQKKPFDLLRAIVAFGGRNVAWTKLTQALWPDTDGDMATHALETTLYRLRKLLGEKSIVTHDGQLSLSGDCCWLDVWAFERLVEFADGAMPPPERAARLIELYRGQFLEDDETASALAQRERLRSKFVRAVVQLGETLETSLRWADAVGLYQKGIEADPLAEELYRRLMQAYRRLDRPAEALAAYRRCCDILKSVLYVEPTRETKALQREIQQGLAADR